MATGAGEIDRLRCSRQATTTFYSASGAVRPSGRKVRMDTRSGVRSVEQANKALNERMSVYPFFEIFMWCSGSLVTESMGSWPDSMWCRWCAVDEKSSIRQPPLCSIIARKT